jgi:hypothetical protein
MDAEAGMSLYKISADVCFSEDAVKAVCDVVTEYGISVITFPALSSTVLNTHDGEDEFQIRTLLRNRRAPRIFHWSGAGGGAPADPEATCNLFDFKNDVIKTML